MIISNLSISKVDTTDPRYPDGDFVAVYLCRIDTDIGPLESSCCFHSIPTDTAMCNMLRYFAKAIEDSYKQVA